MRVLITGAGGFIGSHVARRFVERGADVAALVRPSTDLDRLADIRRALVLIEADLQAATGLHEKIAACDPDVCVHLAWHIPPGRYRHALDNLDSVAGSLNLLQALTQTGCRRVVVVGSCAEYAGRDGCVDDHGEIRPDTLYGASKHAMSLLAHKLADQHGWTATTARLFHVYGPGEPPARLVPSLIRALLEERSFALTSGDQVRDLLYVDDAADALVTIASADVAGGINVASGVPTTVADLAREIGRQLGRPELVQLGVLPRKAEDPQWLCARPGRLHEDLGWRPRHDLVTGLSSTIDWWRRIGHVNRMSAVSQPQN